MTWPDYIANNRGMVELMVNRFADDEADRDDARQLAYLTLMRCHRLYGDKGGHSASFASLAHLSVRRALGAWAVANRKRASRFNEPTAWHRHTAKPVPDDDRDEIELAVAYVNSRLGRKPARIFKAYRHHGTCEGVADELGLTRQHVGEVVTMAKRLVVDWMRKRNEGKTPFSAQKRG